MKIVRRRCRGADGQWLYAARPEMHDIVLILDQTRNQNKPFIQHRHSVFVIEVWADNHP